MDHGDNHDNRFQRLQVGLVRDDLLIDDDDDGHDDGHDDETFEYKEENTKVHRIL